VANRATVDDSGDRGLYRGARGGAGSGYLLQQLLAEVQYLGLPAVLQVPQLVGIDNAHIE
jgi:hypothetical protein